MLKQFFVALGSFLVIDGLWLTLIAKNFYAKHLGYLMAKNPNLLAAGLFYLIYVFAMVVLVVSPGLEKGSFWSTVLSGALFGLCCYATYDLTNLATVQNWPLIVTIVDLIWGTFLSATIAAISFLIFHK
jgi:uncharacterized membrane protein